MTQVILKIEQRKIKTNRLLKQKKAQMDNNLGEQQVDNNNREKTKQQTQEQLSSPLSQVLKTYDYGKFENCELNTMCIEIYTEGPLLACRNVCIWYTSSPGSLIIQ